MKKSFFIVLILVILACFTGVAIADNNTQNDVTLTLQIDNPIMTVNGNSIEIDTVQNTSPIIQNDRTLVPIRAIIEAMGGTVDWDNETQTTTLTYHDNVMKLTINSTIAYLNDVENTLDVMPVVINGRTMLPIQFIAESFDFNIEWDKENSLITIINSQTTMDTPANTEENTETNLLNNKKVLIAYFSQERVIPEDIDSFSAATPHIGNTATAAREIQKQIGGDIFEIVTIKTYPIDDNSSSGIAQQELSDNVRPELSTHVQDMDSYDVIFIGYPIWWSYEPMAVRTFLEEYDFSNKIMIPFCTSGTSNISTSEKDIQSICPNATVLEGLTLKEGRDDFDELISAWLENIDLTK